MFFLLRVAFWLTLALALLPTGSSKPSPDRPQLAASDAVVLATAAVSDMSNFCTRQAEACDTGSKAVQVIAHRAQAGAKMVFDFISGPTTRNETVSGPDTKTPDTTPTGTIPAGSDSQNTLLPDDLAPAWQGPAPHREARPNMDRKPGV